jgi:hypothetical protein
VTATSFLTLLLTYSATDLRIDYHFVSGVPAHVPFAREERPMEELLKSVQEKTGLSMDQAKSAIAAVLGFIRGKLPEQATGQFDTALAGLGQKGPVPTDVPDVDAVAAKTGLAAGQVGSLMETVMTFLKDKLPAGVAEQLTGAVAKGGLTGVAQKLAGMFGRG